MRAWFTILSDHEEDAAQEALRGLPEPRRLTRSTIRRSSECVKVRAEYPCYGSSIYVPWSCVLLRCDLLRAHGLCELTALEVYVAISVGPHNFHFSFTKEQRRMS
jgi:hypothetical protein